MIALTREIYNDLAQELEIGWRVFVHKTTGEKFLLPSEEHLMMTDAELYKEDINFYKKNKKHYLELHKWESREVFDMMEEFAENVVSVKQIRAQLISALANPKPFKNFKFIIDNSGDTREEWFAHKDKWQTDYVQKQYERLMDFEE